MFTDLLEYAVDLAGRLGASYAEARYHVNRSSQILVRFDKVIGVSLGSVNGIGIRVLYDGVLAFSATNDLTPDGIKKAVKQAITQAKLLSNTIHEARGLVEAKVGRVKYEGVAKKSFDSMALEDKLSLLKELWKRASDVVKEGKLTAFTVIYDEGEEVKEIVSSDGAYVASRIVRPSLSINFVLSHPQRGTIQRSVDFGASGGLELLGEWEPEGKIEEEVRAAERVLMYGARPPKEPVEVVIGSEIIGLMVHESAGHPMEADRIWGREAAQAGESYVKPDMIGKERIGNELATVIDDPTIPGSYGFYLYDDEGVPARPRYIYLRGLINEPLHNRWTAYVFRAKSNASARAMNYASEPIPRMANTYLEPGDAEFEELIEDIGLGVYIKSYMEWNIDDIRWGQRYVGLEAYMIKRGELTEPVRNPVLELTTRAFYSSIIAKDKDLKFYPGLCGKGEPPQGVPVWFGGPDVKLSRVKLGVAPR